MDDNNPRVIEQTDDFAVVYKPPKMHCVTQKQKNDRLSGGTLLEWCAENHPPVFDIMHRLDFETHGLVLFAKNAAAFDFFKSMQEKGGFVKEYSAVCSNSVFNPRSINYSASGFPPPPDLAWREPSPEKPLVIMSYFRPYGHGRKLVRPVTDEKKYRETAKDRGGFYRTEIIGGGNGVFTVRIKRGFRHQIRCHLCWVGCPILNDPLYDFQLNSETVSGSEPAAGVLALRAHALFFTDPSTGKPREYRIAPLC